MSSEVVNPKTTVRGPTQNKGVEVSKSVAKWFTGDLGQIPIIATLVVVVIYFEIATRGIFLTPQSLSQLMEEISYITAISLGSVFVLLLGEIDLSIVSIAYVSGAATALLAAPPGGAPGGWFGGNWPIGLAILGGLVAGVIIGLINAFFVAFLRIPSFIVTLATSLFFAGVVIAMLATQETLIISNQSIIALESGNLPDYLGVALPLIALLLYAVYVVFDRLGRVRRGLAVPPAWHTYVNIGIAAVIVFVADAVFVSYRGVPISIAIVLGLIILFWIIMRFTSYGRHVYAVGGNAEAARRAGINVNAIRVSAFVLAGLLGAVGGILLNSYQGAANSNPNPNLLLNAIAAAVIGGVSLFGGKGSVWAVVLGGLILGSISHGLNQIGGSTAVTDIVEGAVLIFAVAADAVLRRRSSNQGR